MLRDYKRKEWLMNIKWFFAGIIPFFISIWAGPYFYSLFQPNAWQQPPIILTTCIVAAVSIAISITNGIK